jgi:16S rRNA (cytosine967-C5)-methyltransferase
LVYATCSLLRRENEDVAAAFAAQHPEFVALAAAPALAQVQVGRAEELDSGGMLRLWPQTHATDGFFAAAWQRAD